METVGGTCEIVEAEEEFTFESRMKEKVKRHSMPRQGHIYSVEEDINRLFDSVNIKASLKAEVLQRNSMKRPIRVNTPQSMGFGTSEPVNLKQALRGLCISQASEMAAMKKRSLKSAGSSRNSDVAKSAGSSRNSDVAIVNQIDEGKRNLIEISSPGKITANISEKIPESVEVSARDSLNKSFRPPEPSTERPVTKTKMVRVPSKDNVVSLLSESASEKSNIELVEDNKPKLTVILRDVCTIRSILEADDLSSPYVNAKFTSETKIESNSIVEVKERSRSRSREKGEFSSSNSSIGEYSSSTSEESSSSGSSRCFHRPHMSKDSRWDSIQSVQQYNGFLSLEHFKLLRRLGSGDIGTVYLAELVGTNCLFALKVMDNEFLARRKKLVRAEVEREILQMLDHPFLPTLYAHFTTDKLSCLVMEYCPGGDLHVVRQKQPNRCFPEQAARFYVAEVLLALEYLHMLGVIYRDLKPENILVREDGHIMLSDFDLSLRCVVNPTLLTSSSPIRDPPTKISSNISSESSCIGNPLCLQPSCQISCFSPRLFTTSSKTLNPKSIQPPQVTRFPQLIAEPTEARSNSFVGTHEYLAPEIIKGEGHGSSVDWWTFGVFLYELLYGKTPFKGSSNEETLANVVSEPLKFPAFPLVSFHARDLIRRLLVKQPQNRLGSVRGTAEIKKHPFFEGLNWALVRCAVPPERPGFRNIPLGLGSREGENGSEHIGFEAF